MICPICNGSGRKRDVSPYRCKPCNGSGGTRDARAAVMYGEPIERRCETCNGDGLRPVARCGCCHGSGAAQPAAVASFVAATSASCYAGIVSSCRDRWPYQVDGEPCAFRRRGEYRAIIPPRVCDHCRHNPEAKEIQ